MTKREKNRLLATRLRKATDKYEKWMLNAFHFDDEMQEVIRRDASDLRYVADLIQDDQPASASRSARRLDTAVRDVIPKSVYNHLAKYYDGGR